MIRRLLVALMLFLAAGPAFAVNPDEVLKDPALEDRARHLSTQLRCLVCQNQSIDDSNAELAKDLRHLLRQRLLAGDTDQQVMDYLVSRYGEFVLLNPRLSTRTIMLWGMPVLLVLLGGIVVIISLRSRRRAPVATALSDEEKAAIAVLVGKGETDAGKAGS